MNPLPTSIEVRLLVVVRVDLTDAELVAGLVISGGQSVSDIVASEILSNLESVAYVRSATVTRPDVSA